MKKTLSAAVVFIAVAFLAQGAQALDFSADTVSKTRQGTFQGKTYVSQNAMRMEMGQTGTTITRLDKKVVWVIMPKERMYMEQAFDPKMAASASEKIEGEVERTFLGDEAINGRPVKKYRVVYNSLGKSEEIYQWIDNATKIPLKTAAVNGEWSFEYMNLKTGPQDQALFEIPDGYQKFSIPNMSDIAGMMKNAGREE